MKWRSILFTLALGMLASRPEARADVPPGWGTNYDGLVSSSRTNRGPLLLYFSATWCGPCKLMARTSMASPEVMQVLSSLDHVALDIDEHSDLASHYGVEAVPTLVLLSAGREVDRATGYQPAADLVEWLTNGISAANAASEKLALGEATLAEVDQLLATPGTHSSGRAAAKLFDLCAERDSALAAAAASRLHTVAASNPTAVLDGLNDPRLPVRICTANVLRETLGDHFDVDPWSNAVTRRKATDAWRATLAGSRIH
jgi:thioredoxin 1